MSKAFRFRGNKDSQILHSTSAERNKESHYERRTKSLSRQPICYPPSLERNAESHCERRIRAFSLDERKPNLDAQNKRRYRDITTDFWLSNMFPKMHQIDRACVLRKFNGDILPALNFLLSLTLDEEETRTPIQDEMCRLKDLENTRVTYKALSVK